MKGNPLDRKIQLLTLALVVPLLLSLTGCGLFSPFLTKEVEKGPERLMQEGLEAFEKGFYDEAAEAFQKVKDRYPYSPLVVEAELKIADALFLKKSYEEAYDAYVEFEKLHPKHSSLPYVLYQKAMCRFKQISTVDRDPSFARLAKDDFLNLVKRFPSSFYARKAEAQLRKCFSHLAKYELYVGDFYFKQGKIRAALGRYLYLLKHYPDMGQYHKALRRLAICKAKLMEEEKKDQD